MDILFLSIIRTIYLGPLIIIKSVGILWTSIYWVYPGEYSFNFYVFCRFPVDILPWIFYFLSIIRTIYFGPLIIIYSVGMLWTSHYWVYPGEYILFLKHNQDNIFWSINYYLFCRYAMDISLLSVSRRIYFIFFEHNQHISLLSVSRRIFFIFWA